MQAVVTGGTAPYTYDWYVSTPAWVTINQHTQSATNIPKGWYEVRVSDANNCGSPTPATARELFLEGVTDSIPPAFVFDSASVVSTCQGQSNGSITIYAHGGVAPLKYSITTGGGSGYQAGNLFGGLPGGAYQTWAMDKKGCKKSGGNKVVVTTPNLPVSVSITANPAGSICPGTSVTFTATPVNGGTSPVYQWKLNGVNVGTGGTTYTNAALVAGDKVSVQLTSSLRCNSGNPATSNIIHSFPAESSQYHRTAGLCQPVRRHQRHVYRNSHRNGLTYQWRKTASTSAAPPTQAIPSMASAQAMQPAIRVIVTGTCGTVTSNTSHPTVIPHRLLPHSRPAQPSASGPTLPSRLWPPEPGLPTSGEKAV